MSSGHSGHIGHRRVDSPFRLYLSINLNLAGWLPPRPIYDRNDHYDQNPERGVIIARGGPR